MTLYNEIVTGLCIGFAGGFGWFVYRWFKSEGKEIVNKVVSKADEFVVDVQDVAGDIQRRVKGE